MNIRLGENIRRLRQESSLTQEQLAEAVGVSPQAVSRWETGISFPDITLLPVLANLFNATTDTLLGVDIAQKQQEIEKALEYNSILHREGKHHEARLSSVRS